MANLWYVVMIKLCVINNDIFIGRLLRKNKIANLKFDESNIFN